MAPCQSRSSPQSLALSTTTAAASSTGTAATLLAQAMGSSPASRAYLLAYPWTHSLMNEATEIKLEQAIMDCCLGSVYCNTQPKWLVFVLADWQIKALGCVAGKCLAHRSVHQLTRILVRGIPNVVLKLTFLAHTHGHLKLQSNAFTCPGLGMLQECCAVYRTPVGNTML